MDKLEWSHIKHLIHYIESQLEWGDAQNWTNKDFETLSEQIFSNTGKQLSVSTLKRIWGKVKRTAQPSISSLDILAEFAGFANWRTFKQEATVDSTDRVIEKSTVNTYLGWVIGVLALIIIGVLVRMNFRQPLEEPLVVKELPHPDSVQFDFEKVTTGYPNTVIFRYDIGDTPFDTLQIQQSWDESKRIGLVKPKGLVTTTYYGPGYYLTKLVLDNQIIKQKDLYIPTKGWQAYIGGNVPDIIYVKEDHIKKGQALHFDSEILNEMNQYHPAHLWVSNLSPSPQINSADFTLESSFRMPQPTEKSVCTEVWMVVVGSKDVFRFEFSMPGCVGDLRFFLNMDMISGKNRDLTAFGLDFSQWNDFKLTNKNNQLIAYINNQEVFTHQLSSDIGLIGGVEFMFEGLGEIRQLVMQDDNNTFDLLD